jgi:CheY-like chemotaxis protein
MATMVTDRGLGYALGATDFLVKPVTRDQLKGVLQKHHCLDKQCRVLVVDDDPSSRALLATQLQKEGCEIEEAADGLQALATLERHRPNLIVLDLLMPNMDGFEFACEIRKHEEWRRIPIIVVTSKDLTVEDRRRLNGHVERILLKGSYSKQDLLREIRELANDSVRARRS